MGGCATKPRELKEEAAPRPIEESKPKVVAVEEEKTKAKAAVTEIQVTNDVVVVVDERKSLGHLFKENEQDEDEDTEEVTVKEAVVESAVEAKEDEQPNTHEPPADEKFITTALPDKTPAPSEAIAADEKHADTSSNVVDAVVAESPKVETIEDEQPKTQEPPADEKLITTPLPEKTPVPSEAAIAAEEKHVDTSSNVVEAAVAESPKVEAEEDEQPKTQEPPADEKFITTPLPEKTPAPSEAIAAEVKHVDTSLNVVDAAVAESPKLEAEEDEQPKTQEPPADEKFITTPLPEKTPAPSEAAIIATEEEKKHVVDTSSNVVVVDAETAPEVEAVVAEQKEAVAPTEEGNTA